MTTSSAEVAIHVDHLAKHYRIHRRAAGLRSSIRSLFHRPYEEVRAVDDIQFDIARGEVVGFLGPNGAGKTTTLKCLAGLLHPTSGMASVLGFLPHRRQREFLTRITLVMGQRNQLLWDLPAMETLLVNQAIYGLPASQFRRSLDELVALLDLEPLLTKQVRKLSLGERMKCELAASLLHRPEVLFLDEPTLGLDVGAQEAIRDFLRRYNQEHQVTILLTSHYMADVTALAQRVLIIDHGKMIYDGLLERLVERLTPFKLLRLTLQRPVAAAELEAVGELEALDGVQATLRVPRAETRDRAAKALSELPVADLAIEERAIENIIREVFRGSVHDV